jgi:outer membrane receptor protein involved in Fe transport
MKGYGAEVTGHPFSTWAGPLGVALGYEWRKAALTVVSNTQDPFPTDGIRFGNGNTQRYRGNDTRPASGSYNVGEVFGEIDAPLLKDFAIHGLSIARSLNLNAALRLTDYSTSGQVNSWKIGSTWQVNPDIRFRVTRSRDVRAPTLNDLYQPQTITSANFADVHTGNISASVKTISQGNLNLKPEKANTWTAGAVFSPSFIQRFTTSVDWYAIDLTDAIQSFGGAQLVAACESSNGTSPLCAGVVRPLPFSDRTPQNFPQLFYAQSFNAVELIVKGVDWEAAYSHSLSGGLLSARLLATYQYDFESQASPQNPLVNSAGYNASPKLIMTVSMGYNKGPMGVNIQTRRIGSWNQNSPPGTTGTLNYYQTPVISAIYYTDLAMHYDFNVGSSKRMQAFFNVNNLFDKQPPLIPTIATPGLAYPTQRSLYDVVFRDFSLGLRLQY